MDQPITAGANGDRIIVSEPDHCFEPYLAASQYAAVLDPLVFSDPSNLPEVLAENPVRSAVACQQDLGSGCVLIVPAEGDDLVLQRCTEDMLMIRHGSGQDWLIPGEDELVSAYHDRTEQLRRERQKVLSELTAVRKRKAVLFMDVDLQRVLMRFRKATDASTSSKGSLATLYNLVEIIEDRLGGEKELRDVLKVSKSDISAVKHPANNAEYDVRHSKSGTPEDLDREPVGNAIEAARRIVQAFINWLARGDEP